MPAYNTPKLDEIAVVYSRTVTGEQIVAAGTVTKVYKGGGGSIHLGFGRVGNGEAVRFTKYDQVHGSSRYSVRAIREGETLEGLKSKHDQQLAQAAAEKRENQARQEAEMDRRQTEREARDKAFLDAFTPMWDAATPVDIGAYTPYSEEQGCPVKARTLIIGQRHGTDIAPAVLVVTYWQQAARFGRDGRMEWAVIANPVGPESSSSAMKGRGDSLSEALANAMASRIAVGSVGAGGAAALVAL